MFRFLSSSLFLAILTLLGIGLVQVYSSSFVFATESYGDGLFFFKKQLLFVAIGLIVLIATVSIPFSYFEKYGWMLWALAIVGISIAFIPGVGVRVGGALRWVQLPFGFRLEPGEFLKACIGLMAGTVFFQKRTQMANLPKVIPIGLALLPLVLLLKQPDFGTFTIITIVSLMLLFSFGLKWSYILPVVGTMLPLFYFLVMTVPYRKARVLGFLDPWSDPEQRGFQVIQSMLSFHSGGIFGVGLGRGQGKLFFLPEAHTDFTLAVLGEEMGFIGLVLLLILYAFVVVRCMQVAIKTPDNFRRVVALGASLTLAFSVFINFGVTMGLLPTKGLTLPFLSYGGSSLVVLCFMFGLVLNIENSLNDDKTAKKFNLKKWIKT